MIEWLDAHFEPGPVFLVLCLVFLVAVPLTWWRFARADRGGGRVRFSSLMGLRRLGSTWGTRLRVVMPLLRTLAILALVFALARPQTGGESVSRREGIAIQMVLDVSGSMAEQDFMLDGRRVRRIDAVKRVFRDFVLGKGGLPGRENDLTGMTTFAMYADTRAPLTLDHGNLVDLLDATEIPGWVDGQRRYEHVEANYTSLGDAIVLATDELRRAGEQAVAGVPGAEAAKSRVMILLTDGADNPPREWAAEAPDPVESAELAAKLGIKIYTIGAVGSPELQRRGFFARPTAQVDEVTLQRVAEATGGRYFRATDTGSLMEIYEAIDQLERRATGSRRYRDNAKAARIAMMSALGLVMFEIFLGATRFRRLP